MADTVVFDPDSLAGLQVDLTRTAAEISAIAHRTDLRSPLFPQSSGETAEAMVRLRDTLAESAEAMVDAVTQMAEYFQGVIDGLQQWDFENAVASYDLCQTGSSPESH